MGNFIKIDRKILDWEWWSDINTCRLFIYMLLKANWKDGRFKGKEIQRGSFVSSINNLSHDTNLTVDEVRTAIKHLKRTNEITSKSHSKYTVFTVVNYNMYQDNPEQLTKQIPSRYHSIPELFPSRYHSIPELFPTIEEYKEREEKEEFKQERKKEVNTPPLPPSQGEQVEKTKRKNFTPPTLDEVIAYCNERNNGIDAQTFIDFYESKGWMIGKNKMKDWKAAVRTWERSRNKNKRQLENRNILDEWRNS